MLNVIDDPDKLEMIHNFMFSFYAPLKSCDQYLRFVFLTGLTKFSQGNIFGGLNNLLDISMSPKYSTVCGISQSEIESQLMDDVKALAEEQNVTTEEALIKLNQQYGGYQFSEESDELLEPFSLFSALSDLEFNNYWIETYLPSVLAGKMKEFHTHLPIIDPAQTFADGFYQPMECMTSILPILYQSGYVTIKDYDRDTDRYLLGIPNKEVAYGLMNSLVPYYVSPDTLTTSNTMIDMYSDLRHDNMDSALNRLKVFMAALPYELENKTEKHFQTIIFVIFKMMTKYVDVEISTATGRIDMVLKTNTHIYVMEFKLDKSAEEAIAQIDTKDYLISYQLDDRKKVKVGINFSSETRTLDNWIIV